MLKMLREAASPLDPSVTADDVIGSFRVSCLKKSTVGKTRCFVAAAHQNEVLATTFDYSFPFSFVLTATNWHNHVHCMVSPAKALTAKSPQNVPMEKHQALSGTSVFECPRPRYIFGTNVQGLA